MNLVALIKPNKKFYIELKKTKMEVFKKYGNQKYVNHLPHLTIFDLKINKKLINKNHKKDLAIRNLNKNHLRLILKKRFYFANDPITKKNTYVIFVKKNNLLKKIQKKLLKRFKEIILKKNKKFNNINLNKNYKNYGYPFVKNDWKPHLTIASIKENYTSDIIFKNFIKKKNIIRENFKFIYFYRYFNGKHILLWKSKIINEKK